MSGDGSPIRSHGDAHCSPMQRRLIQAMERRASNLQGTAKQDVLGRLSSLATEPADPATVAADGNGAPSLSQKDTLRALLDHIAQRSTSPNRADTGPHSASPPFLPPVAALAEARQLWSSLRTASQAREALAAEPTDAGPLNSAQLVHRALKLMRETSPGYLRHFLAYVDTLSHLAEIALEPGKTLAAPTKGRARNKPRPSRQRP